jgi:hypothetical protein
MQLVFIRDRKVQIAIGRNFVGLIRDSILKIR